MTKESLMVAQAEIEQKIKQCAQNNNLNSSEVEPIPDGIYDAEKYLSTTPRILWILKEPYDDFTEEGKPYGGGWSLYEPQIIIFGNTFKFFKKDLVGDDAEPSKRIDGVIHIYEKNEIMMIDAYHPNQKIIGRDMYVNSIIDNCL